MSSTVNKIRLQRHKRILLGTLGTVLAVALSFCGWVYRAKTQRDLNTKLLGAVRKENADAARLLLAHGADPNIRDVTQQPVSLWKQIRHAFHKDELSSDSQADNDKPTVLDMVFQSKSVRFGDIEEVPNENVPLAKALLDAGARSDDSFQRHITPLMKAVSFDQLRTVKLLLDHGANPMAHDDQGRRPMHYIGAIGLDGADRLEIVQLLVKRGAVIDATDNDGSTPLMDIAAGCKDVRVVQFLVAHGANVNLRSKDGNSALLMSTSFGRTETTRFLLEHGAQVNVHDQNENTPLANAAVMNSILDIKMLLALGAKVDAINRNGDTPLIYCVSFCNSLGADMSTSLEIMRLLIDHGADISHRNKEGDSALSLAKKVNWGEAIELLEAAGARQ